MGQRIYIKVVGFSDAERHALNTVFRLSEERDIHYSLWAPDAPEAPRLALLDGDAYEARVEAESPQPEEMNLVWVGEAPPQNSWRTFERPLSWPNVVQVIDELFAPAPELDFDLDLDNGPETLPPEPEAPSKRALIASPDRDERLYLRARLALADLTHADEAESAAQALELMRSHQYEVALVDMALPGADGWAFVRQLTQASPAVRRVIATKDKASWPERVRAWFAGIDALFDKPPHPGKLQQLLERV